MRLYQSVADFSQSALGTFWAANATTTQMAQALVRASQTCDRITRNHLGRNGLTTTTAALTAGATSVTVASTINIDTGAEAYIYLDPNGAAEYVNVSGVSVSDWTNPAYPGTLTFGAPCQFSHDSGVSAQGCWIERHSVRGRSFIQSDFGTPVTQEQQSAEAHAPISTVSDLVRVIFLSSAPIVEILNAQVILRWGNTVTPLPYAQAAVDYAQGWYRLPLGAYVPPGSDVQTTYIGGYGTVPDDVLDALELLAADQLARGDGIQSYGYVQYRSGDQMRSTRQTGAAAGKSVLRLQAEEALQRYVRLIP